MQPRYTATSTVLVFQVVLLTVVPCVSFVAAGAVLGSGWDWPQGIVWTLLMWALMWRVWAVRRYEVLNDRIRFVGVLGSTTVPLWQVQQMDVIEARRLRLLGRWHAVRIKRQPLVFSLAPNAVYVRDPEAFIAAIEARHPV